MKQKFAFLMCFFVLCSFFVFGGMALAEKEVSFTFCCNGQVFRWHEQSKSVFTNQAQLEKHGRNQNGKIRATLVEKITKMGFSLEEAFCYTFSGFDKVLASMEQKLNKQVKNASVTFNPNVYPYFFYSHEQMGFEFEKEEFLKQVLQKLKHQNNVNLNVKLKPIFPTQTEKELRKNTTLRGSFETDFSLSSENRKSNIQTALNKFNGMICVPGQIVSFNKTTGRRTEKNGYKQANIILNNQYVEALGGGVCQVSTTLFNALLLSDITVTESHPHSLQSGYVQNGFDAMVNFGTSDLKWKNQTQNPIYIRAFTTNGKAVVQIFGEPNKFEIRRVCNILETITLKDIAVEDPNLLQNQSFYKVFPKQGSKSESFLEYYENGVLKNKKLVRRQTYNPVQGVKIVGTKQFLPQEIWNNQTFSSFQTL